MIMNYEKRGRARGKQGAIDGNIGAIQGVTALRFYSAAKYLYESNQLLVRAAKRAE